MDVGFSVIIDMLTCQNYSNEAVSESTIVFFQILPKPHKRLLRDWFDDFKKIGIVDEEEQDDEYSESIIYKDRLYVPPNWLEGWNKKTLLALKVADDGTSYLVHDNICSASGTGFSISTKVTIKKSFNQNIFVLDVEMQEMGRYLANKVMEVNRLP